MKSFLKIAILFCIALFSKHTNAQTYNPNPQTWIIDAETSMCENSNNECLLIKQPGKKEFEIFNESIEGFNYEKGNIYTITVRQEIKQPPIAVGESVFKFVLVKIITKKPVNNITTTASNSNTSNGSQKVFEVNFETVPCESDNSKTCLLVKEKGRKEFEILNATIYGFNYQPGYSYTIAVKETSNGNYYLVNEINKNFVQNSSTSYILVENTVDFKESNTKPVTGKIIQPTSIQTSSTLDGRWYLRKLKDTDGSSFVTDDNIMWIDVNTFNDRLDGFGSCNKFAAVVKSDLNTTFTVSKITSGYTNCGNKKLENLFFQLLEQANRFEVKNGNLILSNQWNFLIGYTSNANNKEDINSTYTPPNIVKNEDKIYATNQPIINVEVDKYVPPIKTITTTETNTSSQNSTTSKTPVNLQVTTKTDDVQDKEIEALKKQLEEKKKKDELATQTAKQAENEKQKLAKQKEIDELKKQLAEKEKNIIIEKPVAKTSIIEKEQLSENIKNDVSEDFDDSENGDKKKISSGYQITTFTKSSTNNFPEPEFPLRPYYLDGSELKKLERSEANFAVKQKGIYRGQDRQVQIMKEESAIQFDKKNLPRFIVLIEDENIDPYDVIDLCKADRIGKGRRNFTYAGTKYGGRVKDVTGKLMQLDFKKIRKGVYEIVIDQELPQGEYAFLPLFSASSITSTNSIKANCFGIVDFEQK